MPLRGCIIVRVFLGVLCGFSFSFFALERYALQSIWKNRCSHFDQWQPSPFVRYQNITKETNAKSLVLVSVMTHFGTVNTRAAAINKTWAQDIPGKVLFFVGNSDNKTEVDIPLVILPVADDVYPPQEKAMLMLKYVYENYGDSYQWFIRADDDVYINTDNLGALLISISHNDNVLLGHPGTGTDEEKGKLGLQEESNFCIGGTGIVMSRSVLRKVYPYLDYCIKNTATAHEDSEVGRCIRTFVGAQCPWGYEASELFHQDYGNDQQAYHGDLDLIPFEKVVTLHPVKDAAYIFRIHHHFLTIKQREAQSHARTLKKRLKNTEKIFTASKSNSSVNLFKQPGAYYCLLEHCREFHTADEGVHGKTLPPKTWAMFRDLQSFGVEQFSTPVETIRSSKEKILKLVTERAKQNIIKEEKPELYHGFYFGKYTVGYTRESPIHGNLYEVHYIVRMKRLIDGQLASFRQPRRVKMKNSYGGLVSEIQQKMRKNELINIVVPCQGPINIFQQFLKNVQQLLEQFRETLRVFVVFFREVTQPRSRKLKDIFAIYQKKFGESKFVWVEVDGNPNQNTTLSEVLKHISTNKLILNTKMDFTINADFLKRCRQNTEEAIPYFPLPLKTREKNKDYRNGRWEFENYSTFCAYSNDVIKLRTGNASSESVVATSSLIDLFIAREQQIFRAPDPDLLLLDTSQTLCLTEDNKACSDKFESTKGLFDYVYQKDFLKEFL